MGKNAWQIAIDLGYKIPENIPFYRHTLYSLGQVSDKLGLRIMGVQRHIGKYDESTHAFFLSLDDEKFASFERQVLEKGLGKKVTFDRMSAL
jgi:hypothetical protein